MKKILLFILSFIGLVLFALIGVVVTIFFRPELILTPKTLNFALEKSQFFKSASFKEMQFHHELIHWNKRKFSGSFTDFNFVKENEMKKIAGRLNSVRWNVELEWTKKNGFAWTISEPLSVLSDQLSITTKANDDSPPRDYFKTWDGLWNRFIPEIQLNLKSVDLIDLTKKGKTKHFDLLLHKDDKEITAQFMDFKLLGTKTKIMVLAPKPLKLPVDIKTKNPLYFRELQVVALIQKNDVPVTLTGKIETTKVQVSTNVKKSWIAQGLPEHQVVKNILLTTKGEMSVELLRHKIERLMKAPFNQLPAPLNAMEGSLKISFSTKEGERPEDVATLVRMDVDLEGAKQFLKFHLDSNFDFDTKKMKQGPYVLAIFFEKVVLKLPRLEKNKLPPQFRPDPRFIRAVDFKNDKRKEKRKENKENKEKRKTAEQKERDDLSMHLEADKENPLQIKTNLLDEILKIYFDLQLDEGKIITGFIQTLPLKTEVFRRKVTVNSFRIDFHAPVGPEVLANIDFNLPEYTIMLKINGPLSKPRTAFASKPPLPEDDIIAVLLFGRPLNDLDAEDKTATKKTSQIISQGLLSLSVLYFFAGSPIQSIGYDPESKEVSAQVGLGKRNSLRVSSEGGGVSRAGVKHSLGKGWYIDSSVQKSSSTSGTGNDYGVLLERIISY